jgi:hypothetical protein
MANTIEINAAIIKGYNYVLELAVTLIDKINIGAHDCEEGYRIERILLLAETLQHYVDINTLDATTDGLYLQLLNATDDYVGAGGTLDPNLELPNTIVSGGQNSTWGFITGDIYNQLDLINLLSTKADSGKYFNRTTTPPRPYLDVAEAMSVLPLGVRVAGLTINIAGVEYWWKPEWTTDALLNQAPVIKISATGIDGLTSGGVIDISDFANGNLPIGVSTWNFNEVGYSTNAITTFTGIALSSAGNQRYVAFFGTDLNTIIKVEGTESAAAVLPTSPANSVLLSYVLITDAVVDAPVVDLSAFVTTNTNQNVGGEKNFTNDLSLTNAFLKTNRGIYFYDRIKDSSQPYTSVYPDFSFKALSNGSFKYGFFSSKLPNTQQLDLDYDRETGLFDFKLRPTVNGSNIALKSEVDIKLDISAYNDRFKGKYTTLENLQTAFPTANAGDYAQVDAGTGVDAINYNYDTEEGWIQGGSGSGATDTDQLLEGATNLYYTESRVTANTEVTANTAKRSYPSGDETRLANTSGTNTGDNIFATDAELQTQNTPTEDNKVVRRRGLISWFNWLRGQVVNITARWQFLGIGIGTAGVANAWLILAASTSAIGSFILTFGASYTGTVEGTIWGETTGKKWKVFRNGIADEVIFLGANSGLAGTGYALPILAPDGSLGRGAPLDEEFTLDSDMITAITGATYTSGYSDITPASGKVFRQGESYFDTTTKYKYEAVADNQVIRIIPT